MLGESSELSAQTVHSRLLREIVYSKINSIRKISQWVEWKAHKQKSEYQS